MTHEGTQEHPEIRRRLDSISADNEWDTGTFSEALLASAVSRGRNSIPSPPLKIDLAGWRPFFNDLWKRTLETGREHSAPMIADVSKEKILRGRVTIGSEHAVSVDTETQPGREHAQVAIGIIHTHPHGEGVIPNVFSTHDFFAFLTDTTYQVMVAQYGTNDALLILKTPNTHARTNGLNGRALDEKLRRSINLTVRDVIGPKQSNLMKTVIELNKTLSVEFQLSLYRMKPESGNTFRKIDIFA